MELGIEPERRVSTALLSGGVPKSEHYLLALGSSIPGIPDKRVCHIFALGEGI